MNHWKIAVFATVLGMLGCGLARADGTFIAAANRIDMVSDPYRGIIYITNGDEVLRYGLDCGCMLAPISIPGGNLRGIDLSMDGKTLAVADDNNDGSNVWVDLVDPDTLMFTQASVARSVYGESGSSGVSFLANGDLGVSFAYAVAGTGFGPVRLLDPASGAWETLFVPATAQTMVTASADGQVMGYAEPNISDGAWGVYYPATNQTVPRMGYTNGTSAFNYDIAANADGSQFAIPTSQGTYIYDASYQQVTTLGTSAGMPIGAAYDPLDALAYFPWSGSGGEVRVYDMRTFEQVGTYDFKDDFEHSDLASPSYIQGRTRVSRDGTLLMVSVTGGVRFVSLLNTDPVTATSDGGRVKIALPSVARTTGHIAYGLATSPRHGQAFVNDDVLTYVPDPGFSGTETFSYAAEYHHVTATASVTITVTADTSPYAPLVSFDTLPALQPTTPVPGSSHVPGDFNGDGTSDLMWFNPGTSQAGYWMMHADPHTGALSRSVSKLYTITPGYFIGAVGDFNGDGYADLVFTSASRDLWLWTNNRNGAFTSAHIYDYPAAWQLVGAGDINGDGKDDLLWMDPSDCEFAYWLMDGGKRIGSRVVPVACGYYPVSVGYYTPGKHLSILWSSTAGDLYMWDSQSGGGFHSYDLSDLYAQLGLGTPNPHDRWAVGGGVAGQGIGIESYDPSTRAGFGALLSRNFDRNGQQTGYQAGLSWNGNVGLLNPASAGYVIQNTGSSETALDVLDDGTLSIGAKKLGDGNAPQPGPGLWTYPDGWRVVGAPANGATPLPWR